MRAVYTHFPYTAHRKPGGHFPPSALPRAAAATGLALAVVEQHLSDNHAIAVGAHFVNSDPPQALLDVRAKAILREGKSTPVMGQFDASALDVAQHIGAAHVPEDIKTFLTELQALA
jgi:hypothetical protein